MRSIEFFTYLLPDSHAGGELRPSRTKITRWQAVVWPGAQCLEESRELRWCPESPEERHLFCAPEPDGHPREALPRR